MTLLEALVVVAIVALVTAIGFPSVRADGEAAAWRATVASLVTTTRRARAEAMRRDRPVALDVASDGRSFAIGGREPVRALGGIRLIAGRPLGFFTDGSSTGGAVTLTDGERRGTLTVDAVTGAIAFTVGPT